MGNLYLIIGNGIAGLSAAEQIRKLDNEARIVIVSEEKHNTYYRPSLIEVLSGKFDLSKLYVRSGTWYFERNIDVRLEESVIDIDFDNKVVTTSKEHTISYDKLLIASGAHAWKPPIPGVDKLGVFTLRNLEDALQIHEHAQHSDKAGIIGGGFIGVESAAALAKRGIYVTLIERSSYVLHAQIDETAGKILMEHLQKLGISIYTNAETEEIAGGDWVSGIKLNDGRIIDVDFVLLATGVRSNIMQAFKEKMNIGRCIITDVHMETNIPGVFAAGDVAECEGRWYGIYPAAMQQGRVAGANMVKPGSAEYKEFVSVHTLKVEGIDLTTIGNSKPREGNYDEFAHLDQNNKQYTKIIVQNGKIIGAIILGNKKLMYSITKLIRKKTDISGHEQEVVEGKYS